MAFVACAIAVTLTASEIFTRYGVVGLIALALALSTIAGFVAVVADRLRERYGLHPLEYDQTELFVEPTSDSDYLPSRRPVLRGPTREDRQLR